MSTNTKADIQGKAEAISKLVGQAGLSGKIQTERRTLYQTSDASEAIRLDRYLAYVTCMLVTKDPNTSTREKAEILLQFRRPIPSGPPPRGDIARKFLADVEPSTPFDKIKEQLGAPDLRIDFSNREGASKKTYTLERYKFEELAIYLIKDRRLRAVALHITTTPTMGYPVPYFPSWVDRDPKDLGVMTLSYLKGNCGGRLPAPDARWGFTPLPPCTFGDAGGASFFIFSFDAIDALDTCSLSVLKLKGHDFDSITCPHFWEARPNFALTYFYFEDNNYNFEKGAQQMAAAVLNNIYWRNQ